MIRPSSLSPTFTPLRLRDRLLGSGGIFAYHGVVERTVSPNVHVTPARLHEQLSAMRRRYAIVPLVEYLSRRDQGRSVGGCVAVTFDDAYAGVARLAAPILSDLDVPATLFVVSGAARTGAQFWWDRAEHALLQGADGPWTEIASRAGMQNDPSAAAWDEFRTRVLSRHAGRFDTQSTRAALAIDPDLRSLRFDELAALARDDHYDFAVHTHTHACLPCLPAAECEIEIARCYSALVEHLPRVRAVIAYPYGMFSRDTIECARRAGMRWGVTMEGRAPSRLSSRYAVPRVGVMEDRSPRSIERRLDGLMRPVLFLREKGWRARIPRSV